MNAGLVRDISASFQAAVVDVLTRKTSWAIKKKKIRRVTLSGGVSAKTALRENMKNMGEELRAEGFIPPGSLCSGNAAMIAAAGHHRFLKREFAGLDLNPKAVSDPLILSYT